MQVLYSASTYIYILRYCLALLHMFIIQCHMPTSMASESNRWSSSAIQSVYATCWMYEESNLTSGNLKAIIISKVWAKLTCHGKFCTHYYDGHKQGYQSTWPKKLALVVDLLLEFVRTEESYCCSPVDEVLHHRGYCYKCLRAVMWLVNGLIPREWLSTCIQYAAYTPLHTLFPYYELLGLSAWIL